MENLNKLIEMLLSKEENAAAIIQDFLEENCLGKLFQFKDDYLIRGKDYIHIFGTNFNKRFEIDDPIIIAGWNYGSNTLYQGKLSVIRKKSIDFKYPVFQNTLTRNVSFADIVRLNKNFEGEMILVINHSPELYLRGHGE